jgi:hypothetical protein
MSSQKKKPPYLLQVETAEQSALIVELFQKSAAGAASAHVLAALWTKVQACAKHFESPPS